ncbi:MAG: hypothetical protein GWN29_13190, partial [Gammaproteobacteria bacterium]|nr:hypothetical protein [Gammaproteobacteria bacterium]
MKRQLLTGAVMLALGGPALGHHSDAALDIETVLTIEGTVTEWSLRNPHSYFAVETTNEAGETMSWEVQMGSI